MTKKAVKKPKSNKKVGLALEEVDQITKNEPVVEKAPNPEKVQKEEKPPSAPKVFRKPESHLPTHILAGGWADFETKILDPIRASVVQRFEMRKAYYAGAAMVLQVCNDIAELENDDDGVKVFESVNKEIESFIKEIKSRR